MDDSDPAFITWNVSKHIEVKRMMDDDETYYFIDICDYVYPKELSKMSINNRSKRQTVFPNY